MGAHIELEASVGARRLDEDHLQGKRPCKQAFSVASSDAAAQGLAWESSLCFCAAFRRSATSSLPSSRSGSAYPGNPEPRCELGPRLHGLRSFDTPVTTRVLRGAPRLQAAAQSGLTRTSSIARSMSMSHLG
eukprot:scaffold1954_cov268-Pinguiococcus_pyrenoidosus.AAC.250